LSLFCARIIYFDSEASKSFVLFSNSLARNPSKEETNPLKTIVDRLKRE
jgi:hypothetical protein